MSTIPSFAIPSLLSGTQWATDKVSVTLNYTFWTSTPSYDNDPSENTNFMAFTPTMKQAVLDTLAMISSYCNVTFQEVAQSPVSNTQIGYGLAAIDPSAEAYTYYPDPSQGLTAGDVWGNVTYFTQTSTGAPDPTGSHVVPGDYDYSTIIHETGHAMGLKHPFESPNRIPTAEDSTQYTIMSYTDGAHYAKPGSGNGYQPETYMPYDIAALQQLYGVNTTYHTGDDVYTLQADHIYTIWDAGGNDTLDGSAITTDMTLDLRAGNYSSVAETTTMSQNIAIAFGVTIENANGGSGNDTIFDNEVSNVINGNGGNDTIYLTTGNDTASGGTGNDTFHLGTGNENIDGGGNTDTIIFAGNYGDFNFSNFTATTVDAGTLGGADDVFSNVEDFQFNDITFTSLAALQAGPTSVVLTGDGLANTLNGGIGDDTLSGLGGNDVLNGGNGNDTLDGGTGSDIMTGGAGNDTYYVDVLTDKVIEAANGGNDTIISSITFSLATLTNVENLTLDPAAGAINGTGNTLNNIMTGNASANTLDGGTGVDSFVGGDGNDTFIIRNAADTVTEILGQGTDTMQIAYNNTSTITPDVVDLSSGFFFVENVTITGTGLFNIIGSAADNVLIGNASVNTLTGGGGNDTFDGGAGADHMNGGVGNDTYIVDNVGDVITDTGGTDTVIDKMISGTYTLAAGLENLILNGTAALSAIGNTGANVLTGNAGTNTLNDGGAGAADTLIGGAGNDTYVVNNSGDIITELAAQGTDAVQSSVSFDLSANGLNVENITLTGSGSVNATGNTLSNIITGNSGDNVLDDGGAGLDRLAGGAGNDTYVVELTALSGLGHISDTITDTAGTNDTEELRTAGNATLALTTTMSITLATGLENLDVSQTGATHINLTGNAASNVLTGNAGDNTLTGGAGNDSLFGGDGNDTYILGNAGDAVFESGTVNSTSDTVVIAYNNTTALAVSLNVATWANIENLKVTGTGLYDLTGDSNANTLTGNASVNHMAGGDGNDTYVVGTGDIITETLTGGIDTVMASVTWNLGAGSNLENLTLTGTALSGTGNELDNIITGNNFNNTLTGNDGNDTLLGGLGGDVLLGGLGNDILDGGAGADKLTGGAGADTFVFHGVDAASSANADTITDFTAGVGNDVLDIQNVLQGYNGTDPLAAWVHLTASGANTIVSVDVNGPTGTAHFVNIATLTGVSAASLIDADHMVLNGNLIA